MSLCHRSGIETHIVSLFESRMDEGAWAYDHCRVLRHCSGVKIHINSLSYYQVGMDLRGERLIVVLKRGGYYASYLKLASA